MSIHIVYEARLLIYSFLTGAGLMMVYDLLRVFRIFVPHHPIWMLSLIHISEPTRQRLI